MVLKKLQLMPTFTNFAASLSQLNAIISACVIPMSDRFFSSPSLADWWGRNCKRVSRHTMWNTHQKECGGSSIPSYVSYSGVFPIVSLFILIQSLPLQSLHYVRLSMYVCVCVKHRRDCLQNSLVLFLHFASAKIPQAVSNLRSNKATLSWYRLQFLRWLSVYYQVEEFTVKQRNVNEAETCLCVENRSVSKNHSESIQGFRARSWLSVRDPKSTIHTWMS